MVMRKVEAISPPAGGKECSSFSSPFSSDLYVDDARPEGSPTGDSSLPRKTLRLIAQKFVDAVNSGLQRISTAELYELVHQSDSATKRQLLLVDSRRLDEFEAAHVMGAVHHYPTHLISSALGGRHARLQHCSSFKKCQHAASAPDSFRDADKQNSVVIVYDAMGLRAGFLARRLRRQGFQHVRVLQGSFYKWVDENRPLCCSKRIQEEEEDERREAGEKEEDTCGQLVLPQHELAAFLLPKEKRLRSGFRRNVSRQARRMFGCCCRPKDGAAASA